MHGGSLWLDQEYPIHVNDIQRPTGLSTKKMQYLQHSKEEQSEQRRKVTKIIMKNTRRSAGAKAQRLISLATKK